MKHLASIQGKIGRFLTLIGLLLALLNPSSAPGATTRFTTASGGVWNATSTWSGGNVPGATDAAIILAGASVTVTNSVSVSSVTFTNNSSSTATLTVNAGATLSVGEGITNRNAAANDTFAVIQGGGTINCASFVVAGTTTPTPMSSDFFATLTCTVSNLNISGSLTIKALYNSPQSAANQGVFALGNGSVDANSVVFVTVPFFGPILTLDTGNENGTLTLSSGTPFTSSGGGSSTFTPNGTNATVVYDGAAQTVQPATYQNLTLAGSGGKTLTGVTVNGLLSMQGTAKANPAPTYGAAAVLEYEGSAAQTAGPELTASIGRLRIDNASGLTLTNTITVTNILTLASGDIATGSKQLNIGTNASISGGSSTSYVNGVLQKTFNTGSQSFAFPIGDATTYAPVTLTNLSVSVAGSIKASTTLGNHPQIGTSGVDSTEAVNRYWTLTQSNGTFGTYSADFNYPDTDVDVGAIPSDFVVNRWTGSAWLASTVSGVPTTTLTRIIGQSGFGDFAIGGPFPLDVIWSGNGGANKNWSNGTNWLGLNIPRAVDDVFFYDNGAVVTASNINNVVDSAFPGVVSSVRYGNTNNFHTTFIDSGKTLTVVSNFGVGTETYVSSSQTVVATITGLTGTLDLAMPTNLVFHIRQAVASTTNTPGTPKATLDMSGLGTFKASGVSMAVGVESAALRRAGGVVYLARTNIIRLAGLPAVGTFSSGNPGFYVGHNTQAGNQNADGSAIYLGITNAIFANYIVIARSNQTNNILAFNPAFLPSKPSAYFRGFDGVSRSYLWTIGDQSASGTISVPSSGTNDFTGGKLDAMVDYMFVGRGALNQNTNAASPGFGTLSFDNGVLDVNTLYIGYQNLGTNLTSSGVGTVNVFSTNATLVVNTVLELAHATNTSLASPSGTLNIARGGTVLANTVVSGGGMAVITMTNGTLVVSNTLATAASPLDILTATNSTFEFSVVGNTTNSVVTTLTTGGATNRINLASLPGPVNSTTQFTLIKYSGVIGGAGFNFGLGSLPVASPAHQGYLSNNTAKSAVVFVLLPPPTKLAITSVNGGSPAVAAPFYVVVQSQDTNSTPRNVTTNTAVTVSLNTGTGNLTGTLTGTILAGTSSVTISNAFYDKAESGVVLTATRTSGETLTAGNSSSFTVNPGSQTINFPSPGNQTYGVAPITLTATASSGLTVSYSIISGPASVSTNSLTITGAGSVTIRASQAGNANWNAATPVDQIISVAAKSVTGSITANDKVYDGTTAATIATRSLSGVINGDTVSLTGGTAVFTNKSIGSNKSVTATGLSLSGAQAGYYTLTSTSASTTASITAKNLTVSGLTANSKVYDGGTNATLNTASAMLVGVAVGDTVTLNTGSAVGTFANKTVANGKTVTVSGLTISGTDAGNYTLTQPSPTANITAKALAVSATGVNKAYDAMTNASVTLSDNRVAGDLLTTSYAAAAFLNKNVGTAKTVNVTGISVTGTDSGNYSANTTTNTTANITAKALAVSATGVNKPYDGTATATVTLSDDRIGGDVLTLSYSSATFTNKNVGNGKAVSVSGISVTGTDSGNYSANTTTNTTANITAKALTVSATGVNKPYDGTATATVTLSDDRIGGDVLTLSYSSATFTNKNVGTGKAVSVSGISVTGTDSGNYSANTTANTTANITAKALAVSATGVNKPYDGTATATVTLSDDRIGGDVLTLSYSSATFTNKNVGNGKAVSVSGISVTGTDSGNYSANTTTNTTANITAKALTVSATGVNKPYDGTATATVTLSDDRIGGDVLTLGYSSATFTNKNVGTGKAVSVTGISVTGTDSGNYSANTTAATTANITARTLTVSATGVNKPYDGTATATVTLSDDRIGGDVLTLSYSSATFTNKNVGNGKAVSVSGISVTGTDSGNYSANTTADTTANITVRTLTVSATGVNKPYDGTATATVTLSDDRVAGDVLTISYSSATFANKNVGNGKAVNVTGISVTGTDSGNYSANTTAATTANITARTLTVSATGVNKPYDGTATATVTLSDDRVVGDVLTISYSSATFTNKNVGNGKAVSVSGISVTGTDSGNYSANTTANTTANITARALAVSATGVNKVYDGTNTATVVLSDDRIGGDVLTAGYSSATFADKNVGDGKTVNVTGISVTGTDSGNYSANTTTNTTANITPAGLTVAADNKSRAYGTANPAFTAIYNGFVAGETSSVLSGSPSLTCSADELSAVGTYPIVSAQGSLVAGNYSFTFTNGTLTVFAIAPVISIENMTLPSMSGVTNVFKIECVGAIPNATYHVKASSNLSDWTEIGSAQATAGGVFSYTDTNTVPVRFYRLQAP